MRLFGLYASKPMALARVSGMGLLRDRRRDATPVSTPHYLRHTSALSALIAANMSGVMNAPPGEMAHTSSSASLSGVDRAQFVEAHTQYSFIAVVALMSLFLIITVTATGLMLAFCRKKNAVFTAPEKSDADSHLELDDIDNSDVDICRGEKGECYYHLSDDDDDANDDSVGEDNENEKERERVRKLTKRSRTFPQLKKVLVRRRGKVCGIGKETQVSAADEPLMYKEEPAVSGPGGNDTQNTTLVGPDHGSQDIDAAVRQGPKPVCRNPNHKHYSRQHHNCLYNRPHFHNANQHHHHCRTARHQHFNAACGSRLQRSHTIHYIPQTDPRQWDHRGPTSCGVQIRVQDAETIALCDHRVENGDVGTVQLHHVPTVSSSVRYNPAEVYQTEDLFTDHDHDISFTNLQLRVEDGSHNAPTADAGQTSFDPNTHINPTPWPVGDTYTADQNALRVNQASNDTRLLGEFLTCTAGSYSPNDCIFQRDKPAIEVEAAPQTRRHGKFGPPPHQHYPRPADAQHSPAAQFKSFHNLFTPETRSNADLTSHVLSTNTTQITTATTHPSVEHPTRGDAPKSTCILPPPQTSSKRCIRHGRNGDQKTGDQDFPIQGEISPIDSRTNQRTTSPRVDQTVARPDCNSNYGTGDRQLEPPSLLDMNILIDPDIAAQKSLSRDVLGARLRHANPSVSLDSATGRDEDGDVEDEDCNEDSTRSANSKTCNEIGSDEDQDDLTLSLLK